MNEATNTIDILLLGSGGREHALAVKLAQSPRCGKLYIAPGNGGTVAVGENIALDENDPAAVADFARETGCGLVVIGPEAPLVAGVADAVREAGIPCFGPGAAGAQMEGSKLFSKQVMERAGAPTAAYGSFTDEEGALAYVREQGAPLVVKADGLAAGKGVVVATELAQAEDAVRECFAGAFGAAGSTVVIEEMLTGPECSLLAFTDGRTVRPMATSQDHKRALEGDLGPNTGGMGVYSPVPIVTEDEHAEMERIMEAVVGELAAEGIDYRGCLYGGFMLTPAGPKVLEFNARFGDPETQVILPRLENDLVEVMLACAEQHLDEVELSWLTPVRRERGAHERGVSGQLREGQGHHGHRGRRGHGGRDGLPCRHARGRGGPRAHQRRARAQRDRAGADVRGRARPGLRGLREDRLRGQDPAPRHRPARPARPRGLGLAQRSVRRGRHGQVAPRAFGRAFGDGVVLCHRSGRVVHLGTGSFRVIGPARVSGGWGIHVLSEMRFQDVRRGAVLPEVRGPAR